MSPLTCLRIVEIPASLGGDFQTNSGVPIYSAYGLALNSELPLPELSIASHPTQVTIRLGQVPFSAATGARVLYKPKSATEIIVHSPGVGTASVANGNSICLDPAPGVDPLVLRLFVLQQAFGVLLLQRGYFVLHASAASMNQNALAFAAPSGEGKSTLVAALCREGASVIADDVLAIDAKSHTTLPGLAQLKLTEESLPRIAPDIVATQPIGAKRLCEVDRSTIEHPIPLACIYLLETGATLEFIPVAPAQAAIELVRHTYGARLLHAVGISSRHFQQAADIARHVPVVILRRPRDLSLLPAIVDQIKQRLPSSGPTVAESGFRKSQIKTDPKAAQTESSRP